jgi:outer membrane protein OmpA-like peptidoglycan-associated protein
MQTQLRTTRSLALSLAMVSSLGLAAVAQDATVQGMVIGRDGPQMAVRTADTPRLIVLLSDTTKATQKGGFLGMGGKDLGVESLVPGLSVKVEGSYNPDHQLLAKKVVFSKGSLNTARAIDAGLNPVNAKLGEQQDQLASNKRDISSAQDQLAKNSQDIDATKQGLATTTQATNQNTTQIGQTNTRIGTLDQYETKDSMTINFANGQATVKKSDKDALTDFVKAAANTPGFMIEVQGYASTVGSATLNQRLSAERADNVLAIIQQSGAVPMTRILAPAAMGTTNPVDDGHGRKAQAQNRRVVVTIVVNKGIVGSTGS